MGKYEVFEVGKVYEPFVGMEEGVRFNLSSSGATLVYAFNNPTPDEVAQMQAGKRFEIRFVEFGGIIWITSKCGNLEWTDAPYNPRLSTGLPASEFEDGEGIALTLVMIDSRNGVVKSTRLIGLGTNFSRYLMEEATGLRSCPMTILDASTSIVHTMDRFSSRQLADISQNAARFRLS